VRFSAWATTVRLPYCSAPMTIVRVALDVPVPSLFDYRCDGASDAHIGARVLVPFGRKQALGVVLEVDTPPAIDPARIRPVTRLLDDTEPLPRDLIAMLRFCSDYYHHPIGEVVLGALPTAYRKLGRVSGRKAVRAVQITAAGRAALEVGALERLPAQRRALSLLAAQTDGSIPIASGDSAQRRVQRQLIARGWAVATDVAAHRPQSSHSPEPPPPLTAEQLAAVHAFSRQSDEFRVWLLHGITGSGKTEVYLRTMAAALAAGGQVLMLVPEISLTPQLEARVRDRFGSYGIVTLHSALGEGERARNWSEAQSGDARIVLGTRSAIFAPLPKLALILVDEEHDTSFKQIEGMRYSARDLAVWRARQRDIPVILGSATPSLETYQGALKGRYGIARLTQRASGGALPRIHIVPTFGVKLVEGFAPTVLEAIRTRQQRNEQTLVFINRRGYAPVLVCPACGWAPDCHRCSARLVLHKPRPFLACHHCGLQEPVPRACADCGNVDLRPLGYGTQRIEAALQTALPGARVMRIDRDTTRRRGAWASMRGSIERRDVDLLIGTQLLAKGHDFAGLSLVCVLNADRSLYSTDFRAGEQLFAQLMQVAGRAGRRELPGEVLIQTDFPRHPLYLAVQTHDYDAYAATLLAEREQAGFPPFVFQAVLRAEAPRIADAMRFLHEAAQMAAAIAGHVTVFDPAPATMQRLKGRERAQLLVQSATRSALHRFLDRWSLLLREAKQTRVRWDIDVDPLGI